MKPWLKYVFLGLGAYVVFVIAMFPAGYAYGLMQSRLGPLHVGSTEGTVWDGVAQRTQIGNLGLSRISWHVRPWSLFLGRLEFDLAAQGPGFELTGRAGVGITGQPYLSRIHGRAAGPALGPVLPLRGVDLGGNFAFDLHGLRFASGRVTRASGEILWQRAGIQRPTPVSVGTLVLTAKPQSNGTRVDVADRQGSIGVKGVLTLAANGRYNFDGTFTPRPNTDPQLLRTLQMIGRPLPGGAIRVTYNGLF